MTELSSLEEAKRRAAEQAAELSIARTESELLHVAIDKYNLAHERATDDQNRVFNFIGPVTSESAEKAMRHLTMWARLSTDPVTIRLTSPGGEVRAGLMMYDMLSEMNEDVPVRTIALGSADSMAAIVLQAGSVRLIGRNSTLTLHEIQMFTMFEAKSVSQRKEIDEHLAKLNDRLFAILLSKSKVKEDELKKKTADGKEWMLHPEEAIKKGFVDKVGWR